MDKVTGTVNEFYNDFYKESNLEWRMLCANTKAQNLVEVCHNKNFQKVFEVGAGDGSILYYLNKWGFSNQLYALDMYTPSLIRYLIKSEGLVIKADKSSLIPPKTTKYNEFINKNRKKSLLKTSKIELEFYVKKILGALLGKNKTEKFANAYTILVEKSGKKLEIF